MSLKSASLLLLLAAGPLAGCASDGPWVELKGHRYSVEVADDFEERRRGLMFRNQLEDETGMLFVHDNEQPLAYWMRNTKIPLDILYFDADRKLVSVSKGVPTCSLGDRCPNYPSAGPSLYVLELNAGVASEIGVAAGDELTFGPGIPERGTP